MSHASDRLSYVELSETFEVDGTPTTYPECIVFERDDDGLIRHVSVFIRQPGATRRSRGDARPEVRSAADPSTVLNHGGRNAAEQILAALPGTPVG